MINFKSLTGIAVLTFMTFCAVSYGDEAAPILKSATQPAPSTEAEALTPTAKQKKAQLNAAKAQAQKDKAAQAAAKNADALKAKPDNKVKAKEENPAPAQAADLPATPVVQFENTLVQYGLYQPFAGGKFEGNADINTLSVYANYGIGYFNGLDGIMVAYEGKFYSIDKDGKVSYADEASKISFALLSIFRQQYSVMVPKGEDGKYIEAQILESIKEKALPVAVVLQGKFSKIVLKTFPTPKPPYTSLDEVYEKTGVEKELVDVFGTAVGFYIPPACGLPIKKGWYMFFINEYRDTGGRIESFESSDIWLRADILQRFYLINK